MALGTNPSFLGVPQQGPATTGLLSSGAFPKAQPGQTQQQQQSTSSSGQVFNDPSLVKALSQSTGGAAIASGGDFTDFLNNPVAHPLFQAQLQSLLQSLVPSEQQSRQALADQFRASGGLRSGAFGNAGAALEGNILGNRQTEAGKLLGQSFPQIIQALLGSMGQGNQLIEALKLNQQEQQSTGSSFGTTATPQISAAQGQSILQQQNADQLQGALGRIGF